ncbi:hemolysin activation/secretion protein [Azospirillum fermentarium]|uniref:ShlB/FhaC/HecB family hemolysin secretion/activation protein n=1 Tax=Azospirillum fermentarium TaxID=1233114 RepID=UPI00222776BD|nr:ShlB/FhaC/HecB family hemolysin secretion/activation protein [Azospirillum fermentarium]MCW2246189.1 hemolysin activation/secretion protein [Azospirillum fermentarium]
MPRPRRPLSILAAVLLAGAPALVQTGFAQTMPTLPPSLDPNRLDQRFTTPAQPQSQPEIEMPAPEQAPPPKDAQRITFTLSAVTVTGNSVYDDSTLRPLWEGLLNRPVTLADLYAVRDAITAKYRDAGYALSQAIVPAQRIRGGAVRLEVVEGFVHEVVIRGEAADRLGLLHAMGEKIKAARPLRMDVMERYALLADDLPGVTVRTVLEPARGVPGGSVLTLALERTPLSGFAAVDNRGTRSAGRHQFTASATAEDQLGLFERTTVQGIVTSEIREMRYLDAAHAVPVDAEGTMVDVGLRRSWSRPGDTLKTLDLSSLTTTARVGVSHPFIRSRAETLRGEVSIILRDSRTLLLGQDYTEDRVRIAAVGLSYDVSDGWGGTNLFQVQLSKGLEILNASPSGATGLSRSGGRPDFRKITATAQRNQKVTDTITIVVAGEGQYSPDQLLSSEEFGIGGKIYGRAFDSSEITGDNGFSSRTEAQYLIPAPLPGVDYAMLYGFADYGAVWNYESGSRHGRRSLASSGIGLRAGLLERLDGAVEVAKPLIRTPDAADDRKARVFFTLSSRF